jgi:general secretion pathway protein D
MSSLHRGTAAKAACLFLLLIGGCAELKERYGPRGVTAPRPVGEESFPADELVTGPFKPSGPIAVTPGGAARALSSAEVVVQSPAPQPAGPSTLIGPEFGEPVTLNFVDTDIREVVGTVLGDILGRNYAIDPRVQGRITTRTTQPIARTAIYDVLANILAANGAAIVDDGSVATVVPVSVAQEMPRVVVTSGSGPQQRGYGTYFIPVRNASAASIRETIAGQLSPSSQVSVGPAGDMIVFTGSDQDARAVEEMVRVLDIDVLADRSFALVPLRAARPAELAAEVAAIIGTGSDAPGGSRALPVERLNAILAVANSPAELRELARWVQQLDRADAEQTSTLFVYYLRAGRASDLAATLAEVFGAASGGVQSGSEPTIAPGLDAVEIGTFPISQGMVPTTIGDDTASDVTIMAEEAAYLAPDAGNDFTDDGTGELEAAGSGLRIVADDVRNAIIVHGTPDELQVVRETLTRLDVEPTQILIEATIAEVTLNDTLEYGIRWAFESGDFSAIFTDSPLGRIGATFPGLNLVVNTAEALAVLRALAEITNVEVVSSPQLMVLENQTARLQVGDQVPVLTRSVVPLDALDSDTIVNSVAYFDTGVILEVTPRVNADGLVAMEVVQEVSDAVETRTSDIESPTIQQRRINSTVAVRSGQTIVLGGLIRERQENGRTGIPLLMDIPVLGNVFRTTSRAGVRTELLVLITPRVVRDSFEAQMVTDELRQRLTALRDVVLMNP